MGDPSIAVFQLYDDSTIMDIFCTTLVGQDLSPFELQKLGCVCKKFNTLLYSSIFVKQVFAELKKYGGSKDREILKIGKTKEWRNFIWRKVQGSIVHHNLPLLQKLISAGFAAGYTGIPKLDPLFLCVKYNFAEGYKCLYNNGARSNIEYEEPGYFPGRRLCRIESTYFQAIKDDGVDFHHANHVYLSVAYHHYEILRVLAELVPADVKTAISLKYSLSEKPELDAGVRKTQYEGFFYQRMPVTIKHGLVYLEILRQTPSAIFVEFLLTHGYQIAKEDDKALTDKINTIKHTKNLSISEAGADLPKIQALLQKYSKK